MSRVRLFIVLLAVLAHNFLIPTLGYHCFYDVLLKTVGGNHKALEHFFRELHTELRKLETFETVISRWISSSHTTPYFVSKFRHYQDRNEEID